MASLFELESELQQFVKKQPYAPLAPIKGRKRRRAPAKTAKNGNGSGSYPTRPPAVAGAAPGVAGAPKAASLSSTVDYRVPGIVAPLAQPSSLTSWATVTTMMISWRESAAMAIDTALERAGQQYVDKFRRNESLSAAEKSSFLASIGLVAEPPMNHTVEGWERMLRTYGPLWVTTDEQGGPGFSIHARIITGINGNGAAGDTFLDIVDPAGGRQYRERFADFLEKYKEEPSHAKRRLRIQVVHWPANALTSGQQSYGEMYNYARQTYSQPLYDTGEHVLTGHHQYTDRLRVGKNPGVSFSYGQIIGMAGDMFESVKQMMSTEVAELQRLKALVERQTDYYRTNKSNSSLDVSDDMWEEATHDRYLELAEKNYEHFSPNPPFMEAAFGKTPYKHGHNRSAWEYHHKWAIEQAQQLFLDPKNANVSVFPEWPLIINAFGDHFLTDAFAAGHVINKEATIEYFKASFYNGKSLKSDGESFFRTCGRVGVQGRGQTEIQCAGNL